jgi:zinc transport system substrate-binding protein
MMAFKNKVSLVSGSRFALPFFLCCLFFVQCSHEKRNASAMSVFASILPQKYFIEKIGGKCVEVTIMVEPGASPHSYEPKPFQMTALSKARAYFAQGLEFENVWLPKFEHLNPGMRVIHVDSGIEKTASAVSADEKKEETRSDHHHGGLDPHIWLSPELVKKQARAMYEALVSLDPIHDSIYSSNYHSFLGSIERLQDTLRALLAADSLSSFPKTFMVFHPSWGYFAEEFNLRQLSVEVDGKEPGPRKLEGIFDAARRASIRTIFVQPQFSRQSAQVIANQLHARIAVADDLAYDWEANLLTFARAIALK